MTIFRQTAARYNSTLVPFTTNWKTWWGFLAKINKEKIKENPGSVDFTPAKHTKLFSSLGI